MAAIIHVTKTIPCPDGTRMIVGKVNPGSSYASGGDPLNLSNYFSNASSPTVFIEPAGGYSLVHNGGTAAHGSIKAYQNIFNTSIMNGDASNSPLFEAHTGRNLAALNAAFFAFGPAH